MTNVLLGLIVLVLVWAFVLREPIARWRALRAMRQRVLSGVVPLDEAVPVVMPIAESATLLLMDPDGSLEHEIAIHHLSDAPDEYRYANKTYTKWTEKSPHVWEYRRA